MKLNTDKCHFLLVGTKYEHSWAKIGDGKTWGSNVVKLLDVTVDNKLKSDIYIASILLQS